MGLFVSTTTSRNHLLSTSFINPDGSVAIVVMNRGDTEIPYSFMVGADEVKLVSPGRSIQTLVFELAESFYLDVRDRHLSCPSSSKRSKLSPNPPVAAS